MPPILGMARGPYRKVAVCTRLELYSIPEPNTGCHLWLGSLSGRGYGQLRVSSYGHKAKLRTAHVLTFEAKYGTVPYGLELDHKCRERSCVNPDHLEPVTHLENVRCGARARAKIRAQV